MADKQNEVIEELPEDGTQYSEESLIDGEVYVDQDSQVRTSNRLEPVIVKEKREQTRGLLAMSFVIGFFVLLLIGIVFVIMSEASLADKTKYLQDVILAISGVLSGPLGFVVGYYFRKQEEVDG